jgi:hypothetical protein
VPLPRRSPLHCPGDRSEEGVPFSSGTSPCGVGRGARAEFQLMRLRARLESHFLIVGFTRVHTFVTWDSHELTHNLTGSRAQTLPPGRGEH